LEWWSDNSPKKLEVVSLETSSHQAGFYIASGRANMDTTGERTYSWLLQTMGTACAYYANVGPEWEECSSASTTHERSSSVLNFYFGSPKISFSNIQLYSVKSPQVAKTPIRGDSW
jgi:hypothetical protein